MVIFFHNSLSQENKKESSEIDITKYHFSLSVFQIPEYIFHSF